MFDVPQEDLDGAAAISPLPLKERQGANHLKPHLPFVAVGERADEDALVRLDPLTSLVGELFEQIQGALGDEPVRVSRESLELSRASRLTPDDHQSPIRLGDRAPISADEKSAKRTGFHSH